MGIIADTFYPSKAKVNSVVKHKVLDRMKLLKKRLKVLEEKKL